MYQNPPQWPQHEEDEIAAVVDVLRSGRTNYWTGNVTREFERQFANFTDSKHAIAVGNGTLALDLALKALGIGPGDEVIVTPRSFVASASCVVNAGARPVFADVDPLTQNITAQTVAAVITPASKAIIAVHLAGWPCEMTPLLALAESHGLFVIEDCAQAHGALYCGKSVGSHGHISAWSFCQDKIMTTGGEGGMLTTNDTALWEKAWSFKDHGKSWDAVYNRDHAPGFRWLHESIGTNWRLTEMQSAIGLCQLSKMPVWSDRRLASANQIWKAARELPGLSAPNVPDHIRHAAYKCYVFVDPDTLQKGWDRDEIVAQMMMRGHKVLQGSCSEIYREKAFFDLGIGPRKRLPHAMKLGETSLMFEVHPTQPQDQIDSMLSGLAEVMAMATGR